MTTAEYQGKNLKEAFVYMWQKEGVKGFFKGNWVNIVKIGPFSALEFYFYEVYKHTLFPNAKKEDKLPMVIAGSLTGITAQTLVRKLDTWLV